jgi:hypothetical protein
LVQRLHWRLGLARRSRIARVIFRQIGIISTRRKIGHLSYISDARASTSQREQYGGTVHLFIDTGRSLCEITFMPFMFTIDLRTIRRGLNSLFPP